MTLFQEFAELFEYLHTKSPQDVLVLTPNKRLSRFLRDGYNQHLASRLSEQAWPTLACFSVQGWLQQVWDQLMLNPQQRSILERMPLSSMQERIIWQRVVSDHPDTPALLSTNATGNQAMEAWRLLRQWQVELPDNGDDNSRIFAAWSDAFSAECESRGLVSSALAADVVMGCIRDGLLPCPQSVLLYGFDEMTPQFQNLLGVLRENGTEVAELAWQTQAQQIRRYEFVDEETEIEGAALWAQALLQQNPGQRIAVVIPKLAQLREKVERIFTRVFEPQYLLPQQPQHAPGFNISAMAR